ncbi:hypothetical protein G5I_07831 [Acromyrmex echinatior]|uniref:Uncharacterized protein n=1 Tax=Acromyrmex echinatior TaxID=103372 RepID=F4WPW7_ACREC|nr:hypothetical protein G5I_07831 [Acromyrmex echinatior]
MFTASRLLADEGYGKRKDQVVKSTFKKWEGRSNDDRPVGSTTVSENLTIRLIRNEREFAFSTWGTREKFHGTRSYAKSYTLYIFLCNAASNGKWASDPSMRNRALTSEDSSDVGYAA